MSVYIGLLGILFYKECAVTFNNLESNYRTNHKNYLHGLSLNWSKQPIEVHSWGKEGNYLPLLTTLY